MKRFYLLLALVAVGFISFGHSVTAYAAIAVPAYVTYCDASDNSNYNGGTGYTHAKVSGSEDYNVWLAESQVNSWELGANAKLWFDYQSSQEYSPMASANFTQPFLVINGDDESTVTFAYDGTLSANGSNIDYGSSWYSFSVSLSVNHYDGDGNWVADKYSDDFYKAEADGFNTWNYDDSFTVTYASGELTTGDIFSLDVWLIASYAAEGVSFLGEYLGVDPETEEPMYGEVTSGYLDISADFYNSLRLVSITGGIEPVGGPPVPIPGAVWLLGSGLVGMFVIKRRRTSVAKT
jgi:hypothetical protein